MSCEFCEKKQRIGDEFCDAMWLENNNILRIDNSSGEYRADRVKTNYCPMCERKLNESENNEHTTGT